MTNRPIHRALPAVPGLHPFRIPRRLFITAKRLKAANAESIRLGFSRTLAGIATIPDAMLLHISQAMVHYSATDSPPLKNIRLVIFIPRGPFPKSWRKHVKQLAKRLQPCLLDVTEDTWAAMLSGPQQTRRSAAVNFAFVTRERN